MMLLGGDSLGMPSLVLTVPNTWGDLKYVIWNMVKGLRPQDSSVKYFVYIYTLM